MRTFFVVAALVVSQCFHAQKIIYFDSEWNEIKNKKKLPITEKLQSRENYI